MPSNRSHRSTLLTTLQDLAEADGPPGREDAPRRVAMRHLDHSMRRVRLSPLGSLYAERPSARGGRWMLEASLDEAGFVVSHPGSAGIAWLRPSGWVDPDACQGAPIRFLDRVPATLGVIPCPDGKQGPTRFLADVGSRMGADALAVGSMAVFAEPWQSDRTSVCGKGLEARLGAAIALEVARSTARSPNGLVLALTSLGQVLHRATPAAVADLAPEAAIALGAYAMPRKRTPGTTNVLPGKGPVILLRSARFVADPWVVATLRDAATRARIPYQPAVTNQESSGAVALQSSGDGLPAAAVLVPCTGVGTPRQQVEIRDLQATVELLVALFSRPLRWGMD